ncbi:hypothetical protein [Maritimibacter sp. DP1N21-5]|uniref:hypothetical protein n=1 Tax=Maritimibacter sp. DP1N21-5 TaxID=2836867 RepID=UPI001C48004B|nr:hypothetical protein [Maritimibacter sp. DP1N21-5]MBV7408663.1 hypothetical protein [Maritimibacter sp. DP1N21-5]
MDERSIFRVGLLAWTVTFIGAFLDMGGALGGTIGGVRSMSHFVLWQGMAGVLAVFLFVYGRRFDVRSVPRVASRVPGILLIAILIAAALFWATAGMITDGTIELG